MALIRTARLEDAEAIARVHVASWRTSYAGIIPDEYLANLSVERRIQVWQRTLGDPTLFVYVAEDEAGQMTGFANGGPERTGDPLYRGELMAIYLLEEAQGRGLGRRLLETVAQRLRELGYEKMLIWALAANPAGGFYRKLGGVPLREQIIAVGGIELPEVAYGFDLGA